MYNICHYMENFILEDNMALAPQIKAHQIQHKERQGDFTIQTRSSKPVQWITQGLLNTDSNEPFKNHKITTSFFKIKDLMFA